MITHEVDKIGYAIHSEVVYEYKLVTRVYQDKIAQVGLHYNQAVIRWVTISVWVSATAGGGELTALR